MNLANLKKLSFFVIFSTFVSGCINLPLFKNALAPSSTKEAEDLVKSSWISCDKSNRLVLSFVRQSEGNYLIVFNKTEISDGKLNRESYVIPAVISKAGEKRYLFIKAFDVEEGKNTSPEKGKKTAEIDKTGTAGDSRDICIEDEICIKKEESLSDDKGYMAFYFEIADDFLNLYMLSNEAVVNLVEKGVLKGTISESSWAKDVKVESDSNSLEKVLREISIEELKGDESDPDNVKSFKRKN
jgi:hypothetical protein